MFGTFFKTIELNILDFYSIILFQNEKTFALYLLFTSKFFARTSVILAVVDPPKSFSKFFLSLENEKLKSREPKRSKRSLRNNFLKTLKNGEEILKEKTGKFPTNQLFCLVFTPRNNNFRQGSPCSSSQHLKSNHQKFKPVPFL